MLKGNQKGSTRAIAAAVIGALLLFVIIGVFFFSKGGDDGFPAIDKAIGAVGNLLAEDYLPYIRHNDGYKSAKDITTTGTLTAEQITTTDDMSVTDDLAVSGDLSSIGTTTPSLTNSAPLLVGTSSPSDMNAKAEFYDTGTTTVSIDSSHATRGGCIKMKAIGGAYVYCTVAGTTFSCSATSCE
ncbi:MAG: transmembrane domain-containing protein [Patescibacteria group bacterium]|jgi:hypothetical protein